MGNSDKIKALKILEDRPRLNAVYMNSKGEFFTEKYLADNTNEGKSKTKTFKRPEEIEKSQSEVDNNKGGNPTGNKTEGDQTGDGKTGEDKKKPGFNFFGGKNKE
ncbi:hypothetical protein TMP227_100042 [Tenacibaculum maritimum]|uniref:hypothetical protein n=1 Tax=Tenacibaculum maritimum TaxID=107401 RepID=UPI0012E55A10|nr:hypothetical protein [Tenacibaculum maritimum]CAA0152790.1 hypothetical protein TMP227_100042 [Tenacibaculum maritimum]